MRRGPYSLTRRHLLVAATTLAILAQLLATLVIFGVPRAHRYAAMGQTALVGAAPAAATTHGAGGQWLAVLLLMVVLAAMAAATVLGLRRAVLSRRQVATSLPRQAVLAPRPTRNDAEEGNGTEDGSYAAEEWDQ